MRRLLGNFLEKNFLIFLFTSEEETAESLRLQIVCYRQFGIWKRLQSMYYSIKKNLVGFFGAKVSKYVCHTAGYFFRRTVFVQFGKMMCLWENSGLSEISY